MKKEDERPDETKMEANMCIAFACVTADRLHIIKQLMWAFKLVFEEDVMPRVAEYTHYFHIRE